MNVLISDAEIQSVPVRECGEPLVSVRGLPGLRVIDETRPGHALFHLVRRSVAERLVIAQHALPAGLHLELIEGLRPRWLQRQWFEGHLAALRALHADRDEATLHHEVTGFVADPDSTAPHTTGGAIDVRLVDARGREIDVGCPADTPAHLCEGRCHTAAANLSPQAAQHRRLLVEAMAGAGFVNYWTEWWHWSYGDPYWGWMTGRDAIYGSVPEAEDPPPAAAALA